MTLVSVQASVPKGEVAGYVAPAFRPVFETFVRNFEAHGEVGAALCVIHEGEVVADLWGGSADPKAERPWAQDTVVNIFSCTKAVLAVIAHRLAEQGKLDLDAPVTDLWPDYGVHGKERTTTRMMLDHTAGVPALREPVKDGGFLDWDYATGRIAAEAPFFEPGTRSSYHGLTYAWTVGEMIRRADGRMAGRIFAEDIAAPLGLDFWIGLPEAVEDRVARVLRPRLDPDAPATGFMRALQDRQSISALFFLNDGGFNPNKREYRAVEIGSANGVADARSLARFYMPLSLGGTGGGVSLLGPDYLARLAQVSNASHEDATLRLPMRFGGGVMRSIDNRRLTDPPAPSLIIGENAFGHGGAGGSIGFADPSAGLAFGYIMNQMGQGQLLNSRGQSLVDSAYSVLGFRSNDSGAWIR
ncbi:MAG: serine hydrolase domain-containing protein [Alphaproteobacteria bacterium]